MLSKKIFISIIGVTFLLTNICFAEANCEGKIEMIQVEGSDGELIVKQEHGHWLPIGHISDLTTRVHLSLLLTAQVSDQNVLIRYYGQPQEFCDESHNNESYTAGAVRLY